jgi:hypothetical protein
MRVRSIPGQRRKSAVASESLREELLALPGVAEAEVDEQGDAPSGVRVRLLPDADARAVGAEVQRVLAAHGMRSRLTSEGESEPPPAPLTGAGEPLPEPPQAPPPEVPGPPGRAGLAALTVEESGGGVAVTVATDDGRSATERAESTEQAMFRAVVAAVGAVAEGRPPVPLLITRATADGSEAMTVILEREDGTRVAGAALTRASAAFAVARAAWVALRG